MSREDPQVKLRFPAELKDKIDRAALDSRRSMNAEVVARLEASFSGVADDMDPDLQRAISAAVWKVLQNHKPKA